MKEKILLITLSIFTFLTFNKDANALEAINNERYFNSNNVAMTEKQIENLKNLGFTDKQIELMDQEEFDNNKDLNGEVLTETVKYYKTITIENPGVSLYSLENTPITISKEITEEEYNNSENTAQTFGLTDGKTETKMKKMVSTIIAVNGRFRLKNTVYWKSTPVTRSYDIIGIGNDSTVSGIPSTKYFKRISDISTSEYSYYDMSTNGTWTQKPTGYAVTFKLPNEPTDGYIKTMEIYMYYEVDKLTTATIKTLNAYGDYKHSTVTVSSSVSGSIGVGSSGITLTASLAKKFDKINTAQAQWLDLYW